MQSVREFSASDFRNQSQRRVPSMADERSAAQKRLSEILDRLTQRRKENPEVVTGSKEVKSSPSVSTSRETATVVDELYEQFVEESDSGNPMSVSVLRQLAEEAGVRRKQVPSTSVFESVISEPSPKAVPTGQSLIGQLIKDQQHFANTSSSEQSAPEARVVDTVLQSALTEGPALDIFTDLQGAKAAKQRSLRRGAVVYQNDVLNALEREQSERACCVMPFNAFEEQLQLTRSGRLWPLPVDNELGYDEAQVHFSEHVMLERSLDRLGFPKAGPLRRYAELVCVSLSRNAHLTARQKQAHLAWLRFYLGDRLRVMQRFAHDEEPQAQANSIRVQNEERDAKPRSDSIGTLLSKAERAASKSADGSRSNEMRTEKRQRKDIIQASRTADKVLRQNESTASAADKEAKKKK